LLGEHRRTVHIKGLRNQLNRTDLHVIVFGEFSKGKSTLINALLGREVLPARLVPTTGHITRVVFDQSETVRARFIDGREECHNLDRLGSFSTLNKNNHCFARDDVESIEVAVNCSLLQQRLVLVDTPGVSNSEAQTRRARDAIALGDLVLLVLDATQLLSSSERKLAVDWLSTELGKPVVPVVNRMNLVEEEGDRAEIRLRLDRWCHVHLRSELGRPWFEINALGALKHALGRGTLPGDDFATLRTALATCRGNKRKKLQHRSRYGQLRYEVRQVREWNADLLRQLRADAVQVERERAALRRELLELGRRFDACAKLERERLATAAQKLLDKRLDDLTTVTFKGKNKASLEASAWWWYQEELTDAVRTAEKMAQEQLLQLAGDKLGRPDPLTVREQMILNARLHVGDLPPIAASDAAVRWGGGIGLTIGTYLLPGIGTWAGFKVGRWLANKFGSTEPDYPAAYAAKARESWVEDARNVSNLLLSEFDARSGELKRQIDQRLKEVRPQPAPVEVSRREALENALAQCEQELGSA
jgi:hypothetical protein